MKKHVFIIGSRGYKANYGGWETFVSKLVDNYTDKDTVFHISKLSDNGKEEEIKMNDNLIINSFVVNKNGGIKMLLCTIKAFKFYLKYICEKNIFNSYIYILGLKLGYLLCKDKNKKIIKKYYITILVNPDGLEYKRSKWGYFVKKFFLLSEKWMLNNCDIIVCDAKGIKEYVDDKYPILKNKTTYIAYGTDKVDLSNKNENDVLNEYDLVKDSYILMVGRFVPENNYELVIKGFMNSKLNKNLVIVSNLDASNYYNVILKKTKCESDKRIVFINGIYDEVKLSIIRKNAFAYIHGHSVGGTNPSLLEALNLTNLNILYDINFNKDVGKSSCLYFKNSDNLTKLLDNINKYDRKKLGIECKEIIKQNFTWDIIVNKYKKIFK